jgi:predicted restriction endonuclease
VKGLNRHMKTISELSQIALGDLNHYWTLEDEREFIRLQDDKSAEELAEHFNRDIYEVIVLSLHIRRQQEHQRDLEQQENVQYTPMGDMLFNPLFHKPKCEKWTVEDLEYLCQYHDIDGYLKVSAALDRTTRSCRSQVGNMKKAGLYNHYRKRREEA